MNGILVVETTMWPKCLHCGRDHFGCCFHAFFSFVGFGFPLDLFARPSFRDVSFGGY